MNLLKLALTIHLALVSPNYSEEARKIIFMMDANLEE